MKLHSYHVTSSCLIPLYEFEINQTKITEMTNILKINVRKLNIVKYTQTH